MPSVSRNSNVLPEIPNEVFADILKQMSKEQRCAIARTSYLTHILVNRVEDVSRLKMPETHKNKILQLFKDKAFFGGSAIDDMFDFIDRMNSSKDNDIRKDKKYVYFSYDRNRNCKETFEQLILFSEENALLPVFYTEVGKFYKHNRKVKDSLNLNREVKDFLNECEEYFLETNLPYQDKNLKVIDPDCKLNILNKCSNMQNDMIQEIIQKIIKEMKVNFKIESSEDNRTCIRELINYVENNDLTDEFVTALKVLQLFDDLPNNLIKII